MAYRQFKITRADGVSFEIRAYDSHGIQAALKRRLKARTLLGLVHTWQDGDAVYTFDPCNESGPWCATTGQDHQTTKLSESRQNLNLFDGNSLSGIQQAIQYCKEGAPSLITIDGVVIGKLLPI